MKKHLFLLIVAIASVLRVSAQAVPNGNFENWTQTGNYMEPTSWSTPNPTTSSLSTYTVTRESSIVQTGMYAARIQTKSVLGFQIPGLMTLGTFNINMTTMEATITGGTPFTSRPSSMSGHLQYEPKFGDECFVGVLMLKKSGTQWDTIGTGSYSSTSTFLNWQPFNITIDYTTPDTPSHLNIIILSSDPNNPQPNSTLYIDNLEFQYLPIGIDKAEEAKSTIGYANGQLLLQDIPEGYAGSTLRVYGMDGKLLLGTTTSAIMDYTEMIPMPELTPGIYIATLYKPGRALISRKISVTTH